MGLRKLKANNEFNEHTEPMWDAVVDFIVEDSVASVIDLVEIIDVNQGAFQSQAWESLKQIRAIMEK